MTLERFRLLIPAVAVLLLAACASTTIRDQWFDPAYRGEPFRTVLVLGVSGDGSERRIFEDVMAAKLAERGVTAVPSYRYLADGKASESDIDGAVKRSGADGLLMTRVRRVQTRTQVSTVMVPGPAYGWYGWYSSWYPATDVRQYDIATVETTVFDTRSRQAVWSGITETFNPTSVRQEAPGFADVVLRALAERGLVPAARS